MTVLENRIPPPIVVLIAAVCMALAGNLVPQSPVSGSLHWYLVVAFLAGAAVFIVPAVRAFRAAKTTIDPVHIDRASSLVTTGIFAVTRNPMYVAFTLLLCAWAAYWATPWLIAGPVLFVAFVTRFQIIPEERMLRGLFGDAYTEYCRQTRRWI